MATSSETLPSNSSREPSSDDALRALIGAEVEDLTLYRRALTHRSYVDDPPAGAEAPNEQSNKQSNEHLQRMGRSVLELLVDVKLYEHFPGENEAFFSRMQAQLVSDTPLANAARRCELGRHLRLGAKVEQDGGRKTPRILAEAFAALTGALYVGRSHDAAARFARRYLLDPVNVYTFIDRIRNYKNLLQEHLQASGRPLPTYTVIDREGPDHDVTFTVEVVVSGKALAHGQAGSKKEAEQEAAYEALKRMKGTQHK